MNCEYVQEYYEVPACIGRQVTINGRSGVIVADRGNYIGVNFDNDNPGVVVNAHPTWKADYGGMSKVRKMSRSKRQYRDYLHSETTLTFAEWLGILPKPN